MIAPTESRIEALEAALGLRGAREAAARATDRAAAEKALAAALAARAANLAEYRKLVAKVADCIAPLGALVDRLDAIAADDRAERARQKEAVDRLDGGFVGGSLSGVGIDPASLVKIVEGLRLGMERTIA